ncbi:MAG: energy-coupling factor ABC transporter ATP-binding protein [Moorea sp. SIO2B7]|nr:energy-coupling factor ABC transporter ATP-binding protein [Moorena sp. SIO2B7]
MKQLSKEFSLKKLDPKAIAISNLSFYYHKQLPILNNLNLNILRGERVGLIGPNGAGKTTLFLSICGLLSPETGKINIFGKSVETGQFYPEIGLVFQNPDDQLFCPTVRDDVAFGPENIGLELEEIAYRVEESLSLTGGLHLVDRVPHQLSGGEKCMVAIASVLSMHPQLILYDEPSANLDLQSRRRLIKFLQSSKETILLSSHDLDLILEVCDRVILLNQGKIIADGIPREVMRNKELMEANSLEVPYSLN